MIFIYSKSYEYKLLNLYNDVSFGEFLVIVESNKLETNQKNKFVCKVLSIDKNMKYKNTKLILYTEKQLDYQYGDILKIYGNFEYAKQDRNFKGFNYRRYLWQDKIYGILKSDSAIKIDEKHNFKFYLNRIKIIIENNIERSIENVEYANLLKGILIGEKFAISDDTKEVFKDASLSHILAISGMHLSYIAISIKSLFSFISNKKIKTIISVFIMFLFVTIIGGTPSSIRAFIMFIFLILSELFYRKSNPINNFFSAILIILFINPFYIENIGSWLSFCGTLGIIELYSKIKLKLKNRFINFIFQNFLISICVQIYIFPIIIYNFNTISFTFFISNILISFLIGPIIIIGIIIGIFNNVFCLGNIENILLDIIFQISSFISRWSFSKIYVVTPKLIYIVFYYAFLFLFIKKRKYIKILLKVIIVFVLASNSIGWINNEFTIYFIDVGQGDCTLIKTKTNKTILVDGGEGGSEKFDEGKNTVIPYLLDRGYTKLDYIIISHFDSDHVGGILGVMEEFKVDKIIISKQGESSENFENFLNIVKSKNIKLILANKGDYLKIDKEVWIEFLWPDISNIIKENVLNNNSIVCKIHYKDFSCIFTGDIEKVAEEFMLNKKISVKADILKVAHHGSNTSSCQEFLELVKPKIALIGVGENNMFGHPNTEVIKRLKNLGAKIYRTDLNGEIKISVYENGKMQIKSYIE